MISLISLKRISNYITDIATHMLAQSTTWRDEYQIQSHVWERMRQSHATFLVEKVYETKLCLGHMVLVARNKIKIERSLSYKLQKRQYSFILFLGLFLFILWWTKTSFVKLL